MPTRPNESFVAFFPPQTVATPAPSARMKGTVPEPVVTPPASKMNGKSFFLSGSIAIKAININVMQ